MKKIALLLCALQLGGCCLIDACANDQKAKVTPVEASDKPLPPLDGKAAQP